MGDENKGYPKWRTSLALGHPIGARSTPAGTQLPLGKFSVLYLCFRLTPRRDWLRYLRLEQMGSGRADFMRTRTKSGFSQRAKSACPEKEAKVYQNPRPVAATTSASLHFHWTSHGFCRRYSGSCTVGCKRQH